MDASGVYNLIFSSSATVYGPPKVLPLVETLETGGCTNPYGRTKFFIENIFKDICSVDPVSAGQCSQVNAGQCSKSVLVSAVSQCWSMQSVSAGQCSQVNAVSQFWSMQFGQKCSQSVLANAVRSMQSVNAGQCSQSMLVNAVIQCSSMLVRSMQSVSAGQCSQSLLVNAVRSVQSVSAGQCSQSLLVNAVSAGQRIHQF